MNQFKAGDTNAVVLAGMCTALAVVLSMVGFYVPGISLLALLSLPLPIAYMGIREGVKWDHDGVLSGGDVRLRRDRDGVLLSEARIGAPDFWDDRGGDVFRDAAESSGDDSHDGDALGSGVWKFAGPDAGDGEGNVRSHGVRGSAGSGESADGGNDQKDPEDDSGGDGDGTDGARLGGDADREGGFPSSGTDGFSAVSCAGALAFPSLGAAASPFVCRDAVHAAH